MFENRKARKAAREWLDAQLEVTDEQRAAFIKQKALLPQLIQAKKWSVAIHTDNSNELIESVTYQNHRQPEFQVKTTNPNITKQTDMLSQETIALIDINIRLDKLKDFLEKEEDIPNEESKKLLDKEIKMLEKKEAAIDQKLFETNKKLIAQRQKIVIGYLKKSEVFTPSERRDLLLVYIKDQINELAIEKKHELRMSFDTTSGTRQSLIDFKDQLNRLDSITPNFIKSVQPVIKQISQQIKQCINEFDKALAKELKENNALLKLVENQIDNPAKVKNSHEAIKQTTHIARNMIYVLEKRAHLLSGEDYFKNEDKLSLWRKTLNSIQVANDHVTKTMVANQAIHEAPLQSFSRKGFLDGLKAKNNALKVNKLYTEASYSEQKNIQRLFSNLVKNIDDFSHGKGEQSVMIHRPVTVTEWRNNINAGFKQAKILENDPLAKELNKFFENYLKTKRTFRSQPEKDPNITKESVDDQAKICYAIYYAVTSRDVHSKEQLVKKLRDSLQSADANISKAGKENLAYMANFISTQFKAFHSNDEVAVKAIPSNDQVAARPRAQSQASLIGKFGFLSTPNKAAPSLQHGQRSPEKREVNEQLPVGTKNNNNSRK